MQQPVYRPPTPNSARGRPPQRPVYDMDESAIELQRQPNRSFDRDGSFDRGRDYDRNQENANPNYADDNKFSKNQQIKNKLMERKINRRDRGGTENNYDGGW